jgi:gentisate 1,2-dioxygenase
MKFRLLTCLVCLPIALQVVSAQQAAYKKEPEPKKERVHRASLYEKWLDTVKGFVVRAPVVQDALTQEVRPWPELGVGIKAAYIRLLDSQMMDVTIYEIPPGKAIKPHRHTYEEYVYVASGSGYTDFTREGHVQRLKWGTDAFFATPFNVLHTHVNTGTTPVRLISITSMPTMVNIGGNAAFTYANSFDFRDRYKSQEQYFTESTKQANRFVTQSFIPNIRAAATDPYPERGGTNMHWKMGGNTMLDAHISEFEVGSYKRAHRHRNEAIIYILNGTGYTLVWQNAGDKPQKIDWQQGSLQQVPPFWYHQHFNTGTEPVRYLAITSDGVLSNLGLEDSEEQQTGDEDPAIRKLFEEELQKARAKAAGAAKQP